MSAQKSEDKREQDQKLAICYSKWRKQNESNILDRINLLIGDQTVTGDVAVNPTSCGIVKRKKKEKKVTESAGDPKKGDRFQDRKGKKLTIVNVGSGQIALAGDRIEVRFDGEKYTRDIPMKRFFKPGSFKYIKENGCPKGTVWNKVRKKCVSEGKYVYVVKKGKEFKIPNDPKVIKKYKDRGFEIKESYVQQYSMTKSYDPAGPASKPKKKTKIFKSEKEAKDYLHKKRRIFGGHKTGVAKNPKGKGYIAYVEGRGEIKESIFGATLDSQEIAGSGQTRAVGNYDQSVMNLKKPVRFNKLTGTFSPIEDTVTEKINRILK